MVQITDQRSVPPFRSILSILQGPCAAKPTGSVAVMHLVSWKVIVGDRYTSRGSCVISGTVIEYTQLPNLIASSALAWHGAMPIKRVKTAIGRIANFRCR